MAFKGTISVGGLVAFYTVFISLSSSLYYLAQYSGSLINSAAGLAHIEEVLNAKSGAADAPDAHELPPIREKIELRDYVFTPSPNRRILDGVTLTIRHGESVAFVGPSGSGKSTVLNAVRRSFDPAGGGAFIDGHDLRALTKASFIRQSTVVFQESFLYHTTVRENLRLGRLVATDAEIETACRNAEIHDIIMAMPQGYDSPVGECGSLLSGGQKQRLAIARALLRNPRILFLDEATSALDPGTEIALNATLERLARGRTLLSVTHRLASTTTCDRVFVMNQGQLAESGTHAELIARGRVEILRRDSSGDNFGKLAPLRDTPRNATIRTLVPCIFLTLQRNHFQNLLDSSPEVRAAILA